MSFLVSSKRKKENGVKNLVKLRFLVVRGKRLGLQHQQASFFEQGVHLPKGILETLVARVEVNPLRQTQTRVCFWYLLGFKNVQPEEMGVEDRTIARRRTVQTVDLGPRSPGSGAPHCRESRACFPGRKAQTHR